MFKMMPDNWGPAVHSTSGSIIRTRSEPGFLSYTAQDHYACITLAPMSDRIFVLNGDRRRLSEAAAGSITLIPATSEVFARWKDPQESLLVALPPVQIRQLAEAEYGEVGVHFAPPPPGHFDRTACMLGKLFIKEIRRSQRGILNELYLDSLLTVFSTHLLRTYSNGRRSGVGRRRGGLKTNVLRGVEDYIRANIDKKISLADLAAVCGLSSSHFFRAFHQSTGQPPHRFIMTQRLNLVENLVRNNTFSLAEIAGMAGFSTHSHMTASMQRYWGVTPSEIRRLRD